jgi:hypothetical protein
MNTLRQAIHEYLNMRRDLGFKLREAGKGLLDFAAFMQQRRAPYITQALALAWAQQPQCAQPAHWAQRLSFVRGFARYRSATDPRRFHRKGCCRSNLSERDRTCTRMTRSVACCKRRSTCNTAINVAS